MDQNLPVIIELFIYPTSCHFCKLLSCL